MTWLIVLGILAVIYLSGFLSEKKTKPVSSKQLHYDRM